MKRAFLCGTALLAAVAMTGMTGAALSADLPRGLPAKAPPYAPPPIFDWSGFYVGFNAGGGWGTSSWTDALFPTGDFDISGALVGATLGYNMQLGRWVFGVEGDVNWTDISGTTNVNCPLGCETSNSWLGTARGRIGYAFDRLMPYVTGGLAIGDIQASGPGLIGDESTEVGWTLGGGLEYGFAPRWSAKAEYLYVDLGKFDCGTACGVPAPPDQVELRTHILRGGVNFRF